MKLWIKIRIERIFCRLFWLLTSGYCRLEASRRIRRPAWLHGEQAYSPTSLAAWRAGVFADQQKYNFEIKFSWPGAAPPEIFIIEGGNAQGKGEMVTYKCQQF